MRKRVNKENSAARIQVDQLLKQAKERPLFANRYALIADKILKKYRLKRTSKEKLLICKKCSAFLVPGTTCRVRISNNHLTRTCLECSNSYRIGYKK